MVRLLVQGYPHTTTTPSRSRQLGRQVSHDHRRGAAGAARLARRAAKLATEDNVGKGLAELLVERRVDQRVDGGGDEAEPDEQYLHARRHRAARTRRVRQVQAEERRPADEEAGEHQAQHAGRLLLIGHLNQQLSTMHD